MDIMSWNATSDKIQNKQEEKTQRQWHIWHIRVCVLSFMWPVEKERKRIRTLLWRFQEEWAMWSHLCYNKLIWKWWAGEILQSEREETEAWNRKWCGKEVVHSRVFAWSNLSCFFLVRAPANNWGCVACRDDTALSNGVIQTVLSPWEEPQPGQADKQNSSCWTFGLTDNMQLKWWLKSDIISRKKTWFKRIHALQCSLQNCLQ